MKKLYSNKLVILSLVLPGLLLFVFAILAPICLSVYYGFTDYSGMGSYNYIGLENYHRLMKDQVFWTSLKNSLLLAIGFICIQHPLALIVAAVLDKLGRRGEGFFRCVYFVPNVISVAVIAYLWKFIYNPDFGLLNNIIKLFGGDGGINWLSQGRAIISALKQMETVYLLTNGGPGNSTQFAANYLYQQAFKAFKYGYGNAIGVIFIIICLVVTILLNTVFADRDEDAGRRRNHEPNGYKNVFLEKSASLGGADSCGGRSDLPLNLAGRFFPGKQQ